MINNEEDYTSSLEDEALFAGLLTLRVMGAIQQAHVDGTISLDTHNKLFEKARQADTQVRKLIRRIGDAAREQKEEEQ